MALYTHIKLVPYLSSGNTSRNSHFSLRLLNLLLSSATKYVRVLRARFTTRRLVKVSRVARDNVNSCLQFRQQLNHFGVEPRVFPAINITLKSDIYTVVIPDELRLLLRVLKKKIYGSKGRNTELKAVVRLLYVEEAKEFGGCYSLGISSFQLEHVGTFPRKSACCYTRWNTRGADSAR